MREPFAHDGDSKCEEEESPGIWARVSEADGWTWRGLGQAPGGERRSGAEGRQAADVTLGEAKRTKQKWAWLCKGPSSFATREARSQGWHRMPPICVVGSGFKEAPRAGAANGITTAWSPSKTVLQAVAV